MANVWKDVPADVRAEVKTAALIQLRRKLHRIDGQVDMECEEIRVERLLERRDRVMRAIDAAERLL